MTEPQLPPAIDQRYTGPEAIEAALASLDLDELENEQREVIRLKKKTARPRAVRLLNVIQGLKKNQIKPTDLMIRQVPVIPPNFRPFSVTGDTFIPGDANEMYRDLMEYRRLYNEQEKTFGREAAAPVYGDMVNAVRAVYGFGESPNPKIRARAVKGFFDVVVGTNPKTCYDEKTEILTRRGWVLFKDLLPDDQVGSIDPDTNGFLWTFFENYVDAPYDGLMVKFDRRRQDLLVTPNHRMWIKKRRKNENVSEESDLLRNWEVVDAARLVYASNRTWQQTAAACYTGGAFSKPTEHDITPEDWAALVGWYASEGNAHGSTSVVVWQTDRNMPYCEELEALFERLSNAGVAISRWEKTQGAADDPSLCWGWSIKSPEVGQWLRGHVGERSHSKKLSADIRNWPYELLEGVMISYLKGDGAKRKDGVEFPRQHYTHKFRSAINDDHARIATVSRQLFDDLQEVSFKLGLTLLRVNENSSQAGRYNTNTSEIYCGGLVGRWSFVSDNQTPATWEHYTGRIYCVQVPTGLLVVRRNGKLCVSGNSFYQSKMIAKPVDTVGRGVIIPDADLDMDEVGVPEETAWKLYANYVQRRLITGGMSPGGALQNVKDRTPQARKAMEDELTKRPVVITRSPAWHKFNVVGQRPKLVKGDAIRINTFITDGQNADFNGDSVSGSTSVTYRVSGVVYQSSFEEFAVLIVGKNVDMMVSEANSYTMIYTLKPGSVEVLAMDAFMRPAWVPAHQITIHTSHGSCYDVHTHTGKRVTATEHHNFVRLTDALTLETVKTEDMGTADCYVPAVYNFAVEPVAPTLLEIGSFRVALDADFAWLLGFFAAEGSVTEKDVTFCVTDVDVFERARRIMFDVFGTDTKPQDTTKHKDCILREYRKEITQWFELSCGKGFAGKKVPSFIHTAGREIIYAYFAGVLDGDGNVTSQERIDAAIAVDKAPNSDLRVSMKNRAFLEQVSGLMASVGVRTTLTQDHKATTLTVITPDYAQVAQGCPQSRKLQQLATIVMHNRNGRQSKHDIIPLPASVMRLIQVSAGTLRHPDKNTRARREAWQATLPVVNRIKRVGDHVRAGDPQFISRQTAERFIFTFGSELQDSLLFVKWCQLVRNTAIQWERVTDIVRVEREEVTYDVSIPEGGELFAVAGNLLVHNTMSVHVPSSAEAVKDVQERLMASNMLWSIKDRTKPMGAPKHEQIVGLSYGNEPGGQKRRFKTDKEAMEAIEAGQIDMNDDIEIGETSFPQPII
jgi:intein/homing endonuclease